MTVPVGWLTRPLSERSTQDDDERTTQLDEVRLLQESGYSVTRPANELRTTGYGSSRRSGGYDTQ